MKKLLSMVLAVILVCTMASVAFAADPTITGVIQPIDYNSAVTKSEFQVKDVLYFPLTADMFSWSDGVAHGKTAVLKSVLTKSGNQVEVDTIRGSSTSKSVIKEMKIEDRDAGGTIGKTAHVVIRFVDTSSSVRDIDFDLTFGLKYKRERQSDSELNLMGTLVRDVKYAYSDDTYVNISGGKVLEAVDRVRNIEVELGEGVILTTSLIPDRRYSATVNSNFAAADDQILMKYDAISSVINISVTNFTTTGKCITLNWGTDQYVYNAKMELLGKTDEKIVFANKYYIADEKLTTDGTSASSSSSSKSSSSSSKSSSSATVSGETLTTSAMEKQAQTAVNNASGKTATVKVQNAGSISAEALKAMAKIGTGSSKTVTLYADTMNGKNVSGRMVINTANASKLTSDVKLGVYVDSGNTSATLKKFEKNYKNDIAVVSLAQKGSLGMPVTIAAKVDLGSMNKENLYFYAYDKTANSFVQISKPSYKVDKSGYVHFTTSTGGEIIISDGKLTRK